LNPSDIQLFPVPNVKTFPRELEELSQLVEEDYISKGKILKMNNRLTGVVEVESLTPAVSKPIIDEVDHVLAKAFGLTPEELDFVINYDVKYRLGRDSVEEPD
jgi:hypothetical protein